MAVATEGMSLSAIHARLGRLGRLKPPIVVHGRSWPFQPADDRENAYDDEHINLI
jgi:hypothetical protein